MQALKFFSKSGSGVSFASAVVSPMDKNAQIILTSLLGNGSPTSLKAWSLPESESYAANTRKLTGAVSAGGNAITLDSVVGLGQNLKIFIRDDNSSKQEVADISAVAGNTVILKATLSNAYTVGAQVYVMSDIKEIAILNASSGVNLQGDCVLATEKDSPLMVGIYGTNSVLTIAGYWAS